MTNKPSGYHISKGALGVFYILNCGDAYIKKLSTSLKESKIKAKNLLGYDVPVDVWYRYPYSSSRSFISNKEQIDIYHDEHINSYFIDIENTKVQNHIEEAKVKYSHVGDVGDILDLELTITEIFGFDSNYGYCLAHKFEDSNGNTLIYFGNSKELCEDYDSKFEVKDKITITAYIKRHTRDQRTYVDEYMQVLKPVTVISKPKLIEERANVR
jgi:hypothetical protein